MKLSSIMRIPELKERIVFTLLMFLVARVGTYIPAPGVDVDRLATMTTQLGFKFPFLHFISKNFSAPKSAANPASVIA